MSIISCLLLSQINIEGVPPIPLTSLICGKSERYQHYFDLVQSKTDKHVRVDFHPLGTEKDGYTHSVVRVLSPTYANSLTQKPHLGQLGQVVSFRAEEVCSSHILLLKALYELSI